MVQDSARHGAIWSAGIAFSIASCMAYSIMNGVMMPAVSAGSNQVGARETCEAMRNSPCGDAWVARGTAPIAAAKERPRTLRRPKPGGGGQAMVRSLLCAALQAEIFVGRGIRMAGNQVEGSILHPPALAVEEAKLPQRRVDRTLVHQLLHAVHELGTLGTVDGLRVLDEQLVDVGVAAVDIGAALDDEGLHARGRVAEGAAAALDQIAVLLLGIFLGESGPFHRP